MKFISLTESEKVTLQECYKNHPKHHVRERCLALLLNSEGNSVPFICKTVIKVRTRTVYDWIKRWEEFGIHGIYIQKGRGPKSKLLLEDQLQSEIIKKSEKVREKLDKTIRSALERIPVYSVQIYDPQLLD